MGIRSRIFFTVFGILFVGITLSYIVAERDLSSTLENQIVQELEKQANLSKVTIGSINSYKNPTDLDIIANEVGTSLNSRVTSYISKSALYCLVNAFLGSTRI